MVEFGIILFVAFILWKLIFKPKKEKPIDFSKNSEWYAKEFPDIINPPPPKVEKPNITINITHNHLHIYPEEHKPEEPKISG